ncbi:MAG: TonB-dependent receptor plug domain-containing protein [Thermodesulfobacteriota bacterium]|nr:TonB-dependent receptor plug domain-containing protein [Thermodesulfobacteriota bacterium]
MKFFLCAAVFILTALVQNVFAGEGETQVYQLEAIQVSARAEAQEFDIEPEKTTISVEKYQSIGSVQNLGDIVKDLVIMDYRGATDLVPDDDTLYMRGFSSKRFVTSLDGATIRKTGGRRSSHIVDYALLPPFLVETVEVLPGPHSALFPGKSIGGVVNFVI